MTAVTYAARRFEASAVDFSDMVALLAPAVAPEWWLTSTITQTTLSPKAPVNLKDTTEGRTFGPNGEIRWRLDETTVHILVVAEAAVMKSLHPSSDPDLSLIPDSGVVRIDLWGEWNKKTNSWREGRFRQPLAYDIRGADDGDRVQITTRRLDDTEGGPPVVMFEAVELLSSRRGS